MRRRDFESRGEICAKAYSESGNLLNVVLDPADPARHSESSDTPTQTPSLFAPDFCCVSRSLAAAFLPMLCHLQPGALRFDDSWWMAQLTESEIADLEAKGQRAQEAAARASAAEFSDELRPPRPQEDEPGSESGTPRPDAGEQDPGLPHPGQTIKSNFGVAKRVPVQGAGSGGGSAGGSGTRSAGGSHPVSDQPPSVRLGQRLWALFWSPLAPDPVSERECSRCEDEATGGTHQDEVRAAACDGEFCGSSGPERQEGIEIEEGLKTSLGQQLGSKSTCSLHLADTQARADKQAGVEKSIVPEFVTF